MTRALAVWSNGVRVGTVFDQENIWTFEYAPGWLAREDSFDLSPALPRSAGRIIDGSSTRPVQWYFDNLLPEERMRGVLSKEANIPGDDAFGLLAYFGAESAGSLVLLDSDKSADAEYGLVPLPDHTLSARIRNLPNVSLTHDAPKKMSLAGAQHKLPVVIQDGVLYEPLPGTPSTWILKPAHQSSDYPASVMNEYFTMRVAKALGLDVPNVDIRYVPEPVYLIERFDRAPSADGGHDRLHVVDTCQLLNKSSGFKYHGANVDALRAAIRICLSPAKAKQHLFEWLMFNALIGNGDNHLKNISFMVDRFGFRPAPIYDLLCTAAYETRAFANDNARWPNTELAFSIGASRRFSDVTRDELISAGVQLGLSKNTATRILDRFIAKLPNVVEQVIEEVTATSQAKIQECPDPVSAEQFMAVDQRLLKVIQNIVIRDMLTHMESSTAIRLNLM